MVTAVGEPPDVVEQAHALRLPVSFLSERIDKFNPASKNKYDALVARWDSSISCRLKN
jgi:hypothetical protein